MSSPPENSRLERVARLIDPEARLLRAWGLNGGLSAQMTAFEITLPDGQTKKLILRQPGESALKRNPEAAAAQYKILQVVGSVGLAAQKPYVLDQSCEIFPTPYLVIEYVDGKPDFAPANMSQFVRQLASHLARIHRVNNATLNLSFLPATAARVARKIEETAAKVDMGVDEKRLYEALVAFGTVQPSNETTLVHGDFWPGNVLWKDGELVAVIDWEDAEAGDPLADFAVSRLDIAMIYGLDAMREYTEHYKVLSPIKFDQLLYWDLFAALRAAPNLREWSAVNPELGRPDITEASMRERHGEFVAQAFTRLGEGKFRR